jgi:hypothetical protein
MRIGFRCVGERCLPIALSEAACLEDRFVQLARQGNVPYSVESAESLI